MRIRFASVAALSTIFAFAGLHVLKAQNQSSSVPDHALDNFNHAAPAKPERPAPVGPIAPIDLTQNPEGPNAAKPASPPDNADLMAGLLPVPEKALTPQAMAAQKAPPGPAPTWGLVPLTPGDWDFWNARHAAKIDGKLTLANMDLSAPPSTDPRAPNFYVYHGVTVPMRLDLKRLAVMSRDDLSDADVLKRVAESGIAVSATEPIGFQNWHLIMLGQELKNEADARSRIDKLVSGATFTFASPVFHSNLVRDGWVAVTPDLLIRLKPVAANAGDDVIKALAPQMTVRQSRFGGMSGAYMLRGQARNGFDVLIAANQTAGDPRVKWAEPDCIFSGRHAITPNDPELGNQWAISQANDVDMNGPEGWNITRGVSSVQVLVIDVGVQQNHPDLNQNTGRDFTGGQADGVAGGGPGNACDKHGTAVAGCISARFNNGVGVVGIAPGCRAVSARIGVSSSPCSTSWNGANSYTVNALNWARNNGIQITNNSNDYGSFAQAIDDEYGDTLGDGVIHFASAGNGGTSSLSYPASSGYVNAVSNVKSDGTLNSTSQYGTGLDFSAPGTSVETTDRTGTDGYTSTDYAYVSGTSFASPYAAGVAALVKSLHPTYNPSNIVLAMSAGARDYGTAGYDTTFGYGFVTAYGSLRAFTPSNDLCYTAVVIPSLIWNPAAGNTQTATVSDFYEPQEDCEYNNAGVSNSVWYEFTPLANGTFNFDTFGSNYDTVVSVFDGCNSYFNIGNTIFPFYATQIACNDDYNGLQSAVYNVPVTGGTTYKIKVADYNPTQGGGTLVIHFAFTYTPPPNDSCSSATVIPGTTLDYSPAPYATIGATTGSGCTEVPACSPTSHTVWYSYTPAYNGALSMDTIGSDYDTVLSMYDATNIGCGLPIGQNCAYPTSVGCNDDINYPTIETSQLTGIALTAGRFYLIKIGSYSTTAGGSLHFHFHFVPVIPPNDHCANATAITTDTFTVSGVDTRAADASTSELQESCEYNNVGVSNSVWYSFTPPAGGTVDVDTQGSNYDTVLSIFQGDCTTATEVACDDDTPNNLQSQVTAVPVIGGLPYLIKVADYGGPNGGDLTMHFIFTPYPPPECMGTWATLATNGFGARGYQAMACDVANAQVVMFGGWNGAGPLGDTQVLAGSTWTDVSPQSSPPARYAHAMAYDSLRQQILMFGGVGPGYLNDTWVWDGAAQTWTQLSPAHSPIIRAYPQMVYDSLRDRTVLFGGHDDVGNYLGDTWEWDGTDWTQAAGDGPSPRYSPSMVYDSVRQTTVLFGGYSGVLETDTWEWNGSIWTPSGATGPAARYAQVMAFDSARSLTVLHGGGPRDTWEYDGDSWRKVSTSGPPARNFSAMVFDASRGACVLVGGDAGNNTMLSDVWTWSGPGDDAPVAITGQPASQALCMGDPFSLAVTAIGHAPLSFQWQRDGVDIPGATDATYSVVVSAAEDAGVYVCVVTNVCSTATSAGAGVGFCGIGDLNCDGVLSTADVSLFLQAIFHPELLTACQLGNADMNQDGQINGLDVQPLISALVP